MIGNNDINAWRSLFLPGCIYTYQHDALFTPGCLGHTAGRKPGHAHRHACTHAHTQNVVTFLSYNHGNALRLSKDGWWVPQALHILLKDRAQKCLTSSTPEAMCTPAALHSVSFMPLIWHFHKDDICIRQSRKCPESVGNCFLTGVTSTLRWPSSDVLTIQLTSTLHWAGAPNYLWDLGSEWSEICARVHGWQVTHHATVKGSSHIAPLQHSHRKYVFVTVHVCVCERAVKMFIVFLSIHTWVSASSSIPS